MLTQRPSFFGHGDKARSRRATPRKNTTHETAGFAKHSLPPLIRITVYFWGSLTVPCTKNWRIYEIRLVS